MTLPIYKVAPMKWVDATQTAAGLVDKAASDGWPRPYTIKCKSVDGKLLVTFILDNGWHAPPQQSISVNVVDVVLTDSGGHRLEATLAWAAD
jgi:hypothetical protein